MINYILCKLGFHSRYIEDMGGCFYEVCHNCNWTGRYHEYIKTDQIYELRTDLCGDVARNNDSRS